jgi:hypothetical protein
MGRGGERKGGEVQVTNEQLVREAHDKMASGRFWIAVHEAIFNSIR